MSSQRHRNPELRSRSSDRPEPFDPTTIGLAMSHNIPWSPDTTRPVHSLSSPPRLTTSPNTIGLSEPERCEAHRPRAATTFDGIVHPSQFGKPSPPSRNSSLRRAVTAVRKLVVGRTPAEKAAKVQKEAAKKQADLETAAVYARRRKHLREEALSTGSLGLDSLHELAASEGVYLTPRAHRNDRFFGDDYSLTSGIVARVSGRIGDGEYIFLARDKSLYIGRHDLGRDARPIPRADERIYREYREISRAYYQLCDS